MVAICAILIMEIMGFAKTVSILGICNDCLFSLDDSKVGCVLQIVVVSTLPHAEFGSIGHREEANHFIYIIRYHGIFNNFQISRRLPRYWIFNEKRI